MLSQFSHSRPRWFPLVTIAMLAAAPAVRAQDIWNGTTDNNWNTVTNWSTGAIPSGVTAQFSNTAPGFTSITLAGSGENPTGILFTGAIPSYTIGTSVNDGTLGLNTSGTASAGALAVASSVTTPQTINSAFIDFAASPIFITNLSTLGSTNGTPGLTMAGNLTPPTSSGLEFVQTASAMTLVSGTIVANSNGGVIASTGTLRLTGQNAYTGGTSYSGNGVGQIIQVGSSSNALPGASFTSGPLGTGAITVNNNTLEPVGANQAISNAIIISANGGYTFQVAPTTGYNADASGPWNLELDGPISYAAAATTGRTLTASMTSTAGNILTFGNATTPSTISLSQDTAGSIGTAFKSPGTAGQVQLVVLNDAIQDVKTSGAADTVSWGGTGATLVGTFFRFNSQNTYNGGTGTALTQSSGVFQLNVNTVGSPGAVTSGPFGQGSVNPNNATSPPILEAYGADRTLANAISLAGSGFVVDNASSYTGIGADSSGPHNLSLTGNITVPGSNKNLTNNMVSGVALYLGGSPSSTTPSSTITIASGGSLTLLQQPGGSPLLGLSITAGNGNTVINDTITGAGGLTVKDGATVALNNTGNNYTGATLVTVSTGTLGGTLLVNGSVTASSAVNVQGLGTGSSAVGTGGTLGGTGTIAGTTTISANTAGTQGGIVYPGPGGVTAGTLNVASMSWQPFGRYVFAYNGSNNATGGGVNNLISGSGTLDLSNLSGGSPFDLNLQPIASGPTTQPYIIANFSGGITGAGSVTGSAIHHRDRYSRLVHIKRHAIVGPFYRHDHCGRRRRFVASYPAFLQPRARAGIHPRRLRRPDRSRRLAAGATPYRLVQDWAKSVGHRLLTFPFVGLGRGSYATEGPPN